MDGGGGPGAGGGCFEMPFVNKPHQETLHFQFHIAERIHCSVHKRFKTRFADRKQKNRNKSETFFFNHGIEKQKPFVRKFF